MESDEDSVRINKLIEKELSEDKKKMRNRVKILLLGCGEAGKVIQELCTFLSHPFLSVDIHKADEDHQQL